MAALDRGACGAGSQSRYPTIAIKGLPKKWSSDGSLRSEGTFENRAVGSQGEHERQSLRPGAKLANVLRQAECC